MILEDAQMVCDALNYSGAYVGLFAPYPVTDFDAVAIRYLDYPNIDIAGCATDRNDLMRIIYEIGQTIHKA